jgi:hypothetical protein
MVHLESSFVTAVASAPRIWKENVNFLYLKTILFHFPKNVKMCLTVLSDGRLQFLVQLPDIHPTKIPFPKGQVA